MAGAVLVVEGLVVERGDSVILQGIDWSILPGENWVVLGANGSGKTSLLNVLTGYLMPTAGEVRLLGERFGETDWRELRTAVGVVSYAILQEIGPEEVPIEIVVSGKYAMINYWGTVDPGDRAVAVEILEMVDASHLAERPWRHLSQGERQRVLIGRALMARPKLLILDEPCTGLDPVARECFLEFVSRLGSRSQSPAIVLVTHHVEEIRPIFGHVLLLAEGRVAASGQIRSTLTSRQLSAAFGCEIRLRHLRGRYRMEVVGGPGCYWSDRR